MRWNIPDGIKYILNSVSEGDRFKLLMIKDNYNWTALDTASSSGNPWKVKYLLNSTNRDKREEM